MKAILVLFDSLNRHMLPPYGNDWVHAPNFSRLAEHTVSFTNSYIASSPCMPARRELHTGRYNFLHRGWGPIEPFDDSMPEILKNNNIYTHLATDHYHYLEDGGATYHQRYNTWEIIRGQEGDSWHPQIKDPVIPPVVSEKSGNLWRQDWVNRDYMQNEEGMPQARTFENALSFIRTNHQEDNWFLQLETFDPHEPFFSPQKYKDLYPHDYDGAHFDWPLYRRVVENEETVSHIRYEYAASVSMCDEYLGKLLDLMDELHLWDDTLLIVATDHGFLLGEHGWWGKIVQPFYNEVAHTPLFIWDPRCSRRDAQSDALVQLIDIPATVLEYFGVERPPDMQGLPLGQAVADNIPVREAALFGIHGGHVNITDGRYVYMRGPVRAENIPLFEYTLMPTHMNHLFDVDELQDFTLAEPFSFTKGCRTLRIPERWIRERVDFFQFGSLLFDLENDPKQENPIHNPEVEERMIRLLVQEMQESDSPIEQYQRLGLDEFMLP